MAQKEFTMRWLNIHSSLLISHIKPTATVGECSQRRYHLPIRDWNRYKVLDWHSAWLGRLRFSWVRRICSGYMSWMRDTEHVDAPNCNWCTCCRWCCVQCILGIWVVDCTSEASDATSNPWKEQIKPCIVRVERDNRKGLEAVDISTYRALLK